MKFVRLYFDKRTHLCKAVVEVNYNRCSTLTLFLTPFGKEYIKKINTQVILHL